MWFTFVFLACLPWHGTFALQRNQVKATGASVFSVFSNPQEVANCRKGALDLSAAPPGSELLQHSWGDGMRNADILLLLGTYPKYRNS